MLAVRTRARSLRSAILIAHLCAFVLYAPLVVVCEGAGHAETEWLFSGCCVPSESGMPSRDLDVRAAAEAPDGPCAEACEDTSLPVLAPETPRAHAADAAIGPACLPGRASREAGFADRGPAPSPLVPPPASPSDRSTVLLI